MLCDILSPSFYFRCSLKFAVACVLCLSKLVILYMNLKLSFFFFFLVIHSLTKDENMVLKRHVEFKA